MDNRNGQIVASVQSPQGSSRASFLYSDPHSGIRPPTHSAQRVARAGYTRLRKRRKPCEYGYGSKGVGNLLIWEAFRNVKAVGAAELCRTLPLFVSMDSI